MPGGGYFYKTYRETANKIGVFVMIVVIISILFQLAFPSLDKKLGETGKSKVDSTLKNKMDSTVLRKKVENQVR